MILTVEIGREQYDVLNQQDMKGILKITTILKTNRGDF